MKAIRVLSIIGIVWFALCFLFIVTFLNDNVEASAGWGILCVIYALPLSIACFFLSRDKNQEGMSERLLELNSLKEKGILTEEEFAQKKKMV